MSKAKNKTLSDAERAVLRELNSRKGGEDDLHALYDFAVQRLMRDDDLEAMRDDLIHHAQVLDALPDALKDQPWARAPSAAIRKHIDQVQAKWNETVVYVRERITAYNRKRLVEQGRTSQ